MGHFKLEPECLRGDGWRGDNVRIPTKMHTIFRLSSFASHFLSRYYSYISPQYRRDADVCEHPISDVRTSLPFAEKKTQKNKRESLVNLDNVRDTIVGDW
jgi:hypothetical protein